MLVYVSNRDCSTYVEVDAATAELLILMALGKASLGLSLAR
jgi:hypothetical protein